MSGLRLLVSTENTPTHPTIEVHFVFLSFILSFLSHVRCYRQLRPTKCHFARVKEKRRECVVRFCAPARVAYSGAHAFEICGRSHMANNLDQSIPHNAEVPFSFVPFIRYVCIAFFSVVVAAVVSCFAFISCAVLCLNLWHFGVVHSV